MMQGVEGDTSDTLEKGWTSTGAASSEKDGTAAASPTETGSARRIELVIGYSFGIVVLAGVLML